MGGKHAHILQDEKLWPIEVTVVQVGGDEAIFQPCILAVLVLVYLTESLKTDLKSFQESFIT